MSPSESSNFWLEHFSRNSRWAISARKKNGDPSLPTACATSPLTIVPLRPHSYSMGVSEWDTRKPRLLGLMLLTPTNTQIGLLYIQTRLRSVFKHNVGIDYLNYLLNGLLMSDQEYIITAF